MSMGVIVVVMIVVAMLVVMMMPVVIMVVMAMILRGMVMRGVIVAGRRRRGLGRVGMTGIGAAFGIERRLDLDDARAEPLHHRLDDVVAADAQALWHDLRRQMAIAEMPGDANQVRRIAAADFD